MATSLRGSARARPSPVSVERLVQSCHELGFFLEAAPGSCALAWDNSDRPQIVAAAGNVEAVLGASAAELVDRPAGSIFAGGERAARDLAASCQGGAVSEERTMLRANLESFPAMLLLRESQDGAVGLIRDLASTLERTDTAHRNKDMSKFASLVAHEVRNPLSAVKIALQTLERHGALTPNDRRRVSIANREVGSIEVLLTEVMEFARPPSLEMVPIDPRTPVQEAVGQVEAEWQGRGVLFKSKLAARMVPMHLDPTRVRTAARILCRHAAIAADETGGGLVEVSLLALPGGGCQLTVADPGHPLSPELRAHAFEPFTPTRARGTGLGLAIVQRIAREHGGTAALSDRAGGGNLVTMTFAGT